MALSSVCTCWTSRVWWKRAAVGQRRHRLAHLDGGDFQIALADGKVRGVAVVELALVGALHVLAVGHETRRLVAQRQARLAPEAEAAGVVDDLFRPGLDADLVEPGVAALGQRLDEVQVARVGLLPVVEEDVADVHARRAGELVVLVDGVAVERRRADDDLERRTRRVAGPEGARDERDVRVVVEPVEVRRWRSDGTNRFGSNDG